MTTDTGTTEDGPDEARPVVRELLELDAAELAVLDGPGATTLAPLRRHPAFDDDEWRRAVDAAARSLAADGRAVPGDDGRLVVDDHVARVLAARRSWATAILVEQQTSQTWDFLVVYLRADGRALVEGVDGDGRHRFVAALAEAAVARAALMLMPVDGGFRGVGSDVTGPRVRWSPDRWEAEGARSVASASLVSSVSVLRNHLIDGDRHGVDHRTMSVFVVEDATVVAVGTPEGDLEVGTTDRAGLARELHAASHLATSGA